MLPIVTASQMAAMDRFTIDRIGIPGAALMESAGRGVVEALIEHPLTSGASRYVILCGKGNNGGDGFVVARYLNEIVGDDGFVSLFLCGLLESLKGDCRTMASAAIACGVEIQEIRDDDDLKMLAGALVSSDCVIDALLGSGTEGAPRGMIASVVELIAEFDMPVVAVDCPTGVDMDSGLVHPTSISADLTVTFGAEKIGHRFYPGRESCGKVEVVDIGIPGFAEDEADISLYLAEESDIDGMLPARPADSHKGNYGRVSVVGGSRGFTGAAVMTCESALAAGSGLVSAAIPASLNAVFESKLTEAMTRPVDDGSETGQFCPDAVDELVDSFNSSFDAVAVGPGLGSGESAAKFARSLVKKLNVPLVLDADGLNAFAGRADELTPYGCPLVVTPHPGEMSRLSGLSVEEIRKRPIEVARSFAASHCCVTVLKGAPTIIAEPSGYTVINPTGSQALAKGGSGDVLTGLILSMIGQGANAFDAAVIAVYLHGLAGDIARESLGLRGVLASDIIDAIPAALIKCTGETL